MAEGKVRAGQVWKRNADGATFLVTRIYSEGLGSVAVLRATQSPRGKEPELIRAKLTAGGQAMPGFTPSQSVEEE